MTTIVQKAMINGEAVYAWFFLGFQELQANRQHLNAINVFPVADGDTGSNLTTTIRSMIESTQRSSDFDQMIRNISISGLSHARGNSGILFASYINGMALASSSQSNITIDQFADIAYQAVDYLYQAVENPVEGTMISVIRDWAEFIHQNYSRYDNFQQLFMDAYQAANISLQNTTKKLDVLKKGNLVDAGAQGFVNFLHGINRFYTGEAVTEHLNTKEKPILTGSEDSYQFRYCTEVYLQLAQNYQKIPATELKAAVKHKLKDIGDSLMVAVNEDRMRIHVHINDPSQLTDLTSEYGTFLEQKADDMFLQLAIRRERLSTIGLVTDSIADLPDQYKLEHQIVTIPLGIQLGDSVYLDKLTIKPEKVFSAIHHGKQASSSQPEPLRIRNLLENLLDHYDSLIIIAVSAKLSGTYLSIKQEADRLIQQGKQIILIDSRLNSGAQGLLVKKAAEYIQQGYRYDEITEKILDLRSRISIYVCLNTLEYAVHSGRVPNTIGKLGMKMRLRPIMSLDKEGKGTAFGVGLTQKGITRQIYRLIDSKLRRNGISAYSIVHCGNPELAAEYQLALTEMIGRKPEYVYDISAIIAMHSGPGCVAVSFIEGKED